MTRDQVSGMLAKFSERWKDSTHDVELWVNCLHDVSVEDGRAAWVSVCQLDSPPTPAEFNAAVRALHEQVAEPVSSRIREQFSYLRECLNGRVS